MFFFYWGAVAKQKKGYDKIFVSVHIVRCLSGIYHLRIGDLFCLRIIFFYESHTGREEDYGWAGLQRVFISLQFAQLLSQQAELWEKESFMRCRYTTCGRDSGSIVFCYTHWIGDMADMPVLGYICERTI